MPVRCHLESTDPVLVVRLAGALRLAAADSAWHTLVELLSRQPDVLVVDLTEAGFDEPRALLVLGALARRASLWPGVPVILAAPDPRLRDNLERLGVGRQLTVCADRDEALLLARAAPRPPRLCEELEPVPGAARRARDLVTEACLRWRLPHHLVAPACVVASELATNAVRHARTRCAVSVALTSNYLHIAVRDGDPAPVVPRMPDPLAVSGRGLLIVARTALRWGSTPAGQGKVVWATLPAR